MLYMYPRTMESPLGDQWTRIYLYLGTKVLKEMPEDIAQRELSQYDMSHLRDLKRWIKGKIVEARKARRRQEKKVEAGTKAEIQPEKCEQAKLF